MEQIATTFRHVVVIVLFCQSAFYCDSLFRERQKLRSVLHVPLVSTVAEVLSPVITATSKQDKTIPLPLHSFVDKPSAKADFWVISVDFRVA